MLSLIGDVSPPLLFHPIIKHVYGLQRQRKVLVVFIISLLSSNIGMLVEKWTDSKAARRAERTLVDELRWHLIHVPASI